MACGARASRARLATEKAPDSSEYLAAANNSQAPQNASSVSCKQSPPASENLIGPEFSQRPSRGEKSRHSSALIFQSTRDQLL